MPLDSVNAYIAMALGLSGLIGIIIQIGKTKSDLELSIVKLSSRLDLLLSQADSKLKMDDYRLKLHESQLRELKAHIQDVENALNQRFGYNIKNYNALPDSAVRLQQEE